MEQLCFCWRRCAFSPCVQTAAIQMPSRVLSSYVWRSSPSVPAVAVQPWSLKAVACSSRLRIPAPGATCMATNHAKTDESPSKQPGHWIDFRFDHLRRNRPFTCCSVGNGHVPHGHCNRDGLPDRSATGANLVARPRSGMIGVVPVAAILLFGLLACIASLLLGFRPSSRRARPTRISRHRRALPQARTSRHPNEIT